MPFLDANGTTLFYRDWGAGRPVLFCAASTVTSCEFQYQMVHMVDNGFRAISYDRRGHGRSDDPGTGYDYDTLSDDLGALIEHLDLRELTLVGHSMAGGEIIRYLTRYGAERVSRIVLVAATLPLLVQTPTNPDGVDPGILAAVRAGWRRDFGEWLNAQEGPYFGDGLPGNAVSRASRDWTRNDILLTSLQAIIECQRTNTETDFRAEMPNITVPTLIIHGDHDAGLPLEMTARRQAELLPNSRLEIYENAPHGLYLTHGDRLNDDLLAFVREDVPASVGR